MLNKTILNNDYRVAFLIRKSRFCAVEYQLS